MTLPTPAVWPDVPSDQVPKLPLKDMKPFSEFNQSSNVFVDISSEEHRTYVFPGGNEVTIVRPTHLSVSTSGHRLLDESGFSHYVPKGWIHLKWIVKTGLPHFVK